MNKSDIFSEVEDFSAEYLRSVGYFPLRVSVFDHWLSESEAESSQIISFGEAMQHGKYDAYKLGENNFINLYRILTEDFKYCIAYDGSLVDVNMIKGSLREDSLVDFYVEPFDLRVMGGYDRTDLLLLRNNKFLGEVTNLIINCGLYILPER